ncbi:c-type cytochrome [Magnetovirga frankeli]|uniref:cytochrome-c peroxidase n=1 Tax=Magnetovirga frankeli TaxID=947516 RepID=UPI0012939F97|nr:c-type cytochrome [gamma proteobacterium SS-5]
MPYRTLNLVLVTALALLLSGPGLAADPERLIRKANRYLAPLPAAMPGAENDTPERIALGEKLYHDTRLSINNAQSCASCHPVRDGRAGVDNLPTSPGAEGQLGDRNSPTVLNAGWQSSQFWDGRAKDLADQAGQPILNPVEMAMPNEQAVVDKLRQTPDYPAEFAQAFPDAAEPISYANLSEALAAFERTLRSESRFDDYLKGDTSALSEQEQRGLDAFMSHNCIRCHDGPLLGGGLYERLGGAGHGDFPSTDPGRFAVTGKEEDRQVFKVPQLRNIALTGPWFHNGSINTLEEAIRLMAQLQLGTELKPEEIADISAFLRSLNGKGLAE